MRIDGYAPIRDYAVIGDGRTAALVARDGAIDWWCIPDLDSPTVFGGLLDARRGGSFALAPIDDFDSAREYRPGSNVLETTFTTSTGRVRVVDAMTLATGHRLVPLRELVRRVDGLDGSVRMTWRIEPRVDYARSASSLEQRGTGRVLTQAGDTALAISVWGESDSLREDDAYSGELDVAEGESALFALTVAHREPAVFPGREDAEERLEEADRFWRAWSRQASYEGPWRDAVLRSVLALKLLVFSPSGAIVAAPTSSLPEELGGVRNWDYRFSWLRDSSYTLEALDSLGIEEEARAYFWWLMHASRRTHPRLDVLYRVDGSTSTTELELPHFEGYRTSSPVRIGNGAAGQLQLDVYGAVLDGAWRHVRQHGDLGGERGRSVATIADYVAGHWREPDSGIWEVRSEAAQFVHSKAMCWLALERAARLAQEGVLPGGADRWREEAGKIREYVDERGWDPERGSYVQAVGQPELDASLLTLPMIGFDDGPRAAATVDAVRRELAEGPLVYRYRTADGLEGSDSPFLTCSFWLADALARTGRLDEARKLMDELVALANDVGLYAEEMDAETGEFLGNFPQGLVHLALINAAVSIAGREMAA
jgi:GH15 family glucan-1,4-alpha-glucosidase